MWQLAGLSDLIPAVLVHLFFLFCYFCICKKHFEVWADKIEKKKNSVCWVCVWILSVCALAWTLYRLSLILTHTVSTNEPFLHSGWHSKGDNELDHSQCKCMCVCLHFKIYVSARETNMRASLAPVYTCCVLLWTCRTCVLYSHVFSDIWWVREGTQWMFCPVGEAIAGIAVVI